MIPPATVQVWWARRGDAAPRLEPLLDEVEHERWRAYRREEDRERFLVGCALAKIAAAIHVGGPAAAIHLDRTCETCGKPHGKPRLDGSGLELSVSHSGEIVGVALATGTPIGLDVEQLTDGNPASELAGTVLSDSEAASLAGSARASASERSSSRGRERRR